MGKNRYTFVILLMIGLIAISCVPQEDILGQATKATAACKKPSGTLSISTPGFVLYPGESRTVTIEGTAAPGCVFKTSKKGGMFLKTSEYDYGSKKWGKLKTVEFNAEGPTSSSVSKDFILAFGESNKEVGAQQFVANVCGKKKCKTIKSGFTWEYGAKVAIPLEGQVISETMKVPGGSATNEFPLVVRIEGTESALAQIPNKLTVHLTPEDNEPIEIELPRGAEACYDESRSGCFKEYVAPVAGLTPARYNIKILTEIAANVPAADMEIQQVDDALMENIIREDIPDPNDPQNPYIFLDSGVTTKGGYPESWATYEKRDTQNNIVTKMMVSVRSIDEKTARIFEQTVQDDSLIPINDRLVRVVDNPDGSIEYSWLSETPGYPVQLVTIHEKPQGISFAASSPALIAIPKVTGLVPTGGVSYNPVAGAQLGLTPGQATPASASQGTQTATVEDVVCPPKENIDAARARVNAEFDAAQSAAESERQQARKNVEDKANACTSKIDRKGPCDKQWDNIQSENAKGTDPTSAAGQKARNDWKDCYDKTYNIGPGQAGHDPNKYDPNLDKWKNKQQKAEKDCDDKVKDERDKADNDYFQKVNDARAARDAALAVLAEKENNCGDADGGSQSLQLRIGTSRSSECAAGSVFEGAQTSLRSSCDALEGKRNRILSVITILEAEAKDLEQRIVVTQQQLEQAKNDVERGGKLVPQRQKELSALRDKLQKNVERQQELMQKLVDVEQKLTNLGCQAEQTCTTDADCGNQICCSARSVGLRACVDGTCAIQEQSCISEQTCEKFPTPAGEAGQCKAPEEEPEEEPAAVTCPLFAHEDEKKCYECKHYLGFSELDWETLTRRTVQGTIPSSINLLRGAYLTEIRQRARKLMLELVNSIPGGAAAIPAEIASLNNVLDARTEVGELEALLDNEINKLVECQELRCPPERQPEYVPLENTCSKPAYKGPCDALIVRIEPKRKAIYDAEKFLYEHDKLDTINSKLDEVKRELDGLSSEEDTFIDEAHNEFMVSLRNEFEEYLWSIPRGDGESNPDELLQNKFDSILRPEAQDSARRLLDKKRTVIESRKDKLESERDIIETINEDIKQKRDALTAEELQSLDTCIEMCENGGCPVGSTRGEERDCEQTSGNPSLCWQYEKYLGCWIIIHTNPGKGFKQSSRA